MSDIDRIELKQREVAYATRAYERTGMTLNSQIHSAKTELLKSKKTWLEALRKNNRYLDTVTAHSRSSFLDKLSDQSRAAKMKHSLHSIKINSLAEQLQANGKALLVSKQKLEYIGKIHLGLRRAEFKKKELSEAEEISESALIKSLQVKEAEKKEDLIAPTDGNLIDFVDLPQNLPLQDPPSQSSPSIAALIQSINYDLPHHRHSDSQQSTPLPERQPRTSHQEVPQQPTEKNEALSEIKVDCSGGQVSVSAIYRSSSGKEVQLSVSQAADRSIDVRLDSSVDDGESIRRTLTQAGIPLSSLTVETQGTC